MTQGPMSVDPVFVVPKNDELICCDCKNRNARNIAAGTCKSYPDAKPLAVFRERTCPSYEAEAWGAL